MGKWLTKCRRLFQADKTATKRSEEPGLMKNAPWDATYDRSGTSKDLYGARPDNKNLVNKKQRG